MSQAQTTEPISEAPRPAPYLTSEMRTYEVRWRDGKVERVTCRWVDFSKSEVIHFTQWAADGPPLVLTVCAAEIYSVRPVVPDDEAES